MTKIIITGVAIFIIGILIGAYATVKAVNQIHLEDR